MPLLVRRVEAHDGGLTAEFDCRNDRIQFAASRLRSNCSRDSQSSTNNRIHDVEVRIQAGVQTSRRDPRRPSRRQARAAGPSAYVRSHDLQENTITLNVFRAAVTKRDGPALHRKKRANSEPPRVRPKDQMKQWG